MDKQIDDGGSAFPAEYYSPEAYAKFRHVGEGLHSAKGLATGKSKGMSLLDYAAIHADLGNLQFDSIESAAGFLGIPVPKCDDVNALIALAARAAAKARYAFAEALIAERSARISSKQDGESCGPN